MIWGNTTQIEMSAQQKEVYCKYANGSVWIGTRLISFSSTLPWWFSPLTLASWKKKGKMKLPPFWATLWGNLGIIVALIYPENPANPFFHLDVPELMPKLPHHTGSASPDLCSVTCFLPFATSAVLCWWIRVCNLQLSGPDLLLWDKCFTSCLVTVMLVC